MIRNEYYIKNKEKLKKYQRERYANMSDSDKAAEIKKAIDRRNYILKHIGRQKGGSSGS